MACNSNVVVPELLQDECKGCLTTTDCINIVELYPSLGVVEIVELTKLIEQVVNKLSELETRIENLENGM